MAGATARSRHATIEALAAGKTKSGAKKKRQAAKRKEARSAAESKPEATTGGGDRDGSDASLNTGETLADPSPLWVRIPSAPRRSERLKS